MHKIIHILLAVVALLISPFYVLLTSGVDVYLAVPAYSVLMLIGFFNLVLMTVDYDDQTKGQVIVSVLMAITTILSILSVLVGGTALFVWTLFFIAITVAAHGFVICPCACPFSFGGGSDDDFGSAEREVGTVKWFNTGKGFGFIRRESGEEIFVHFRAIRGRGRRILREGQKVEFSVADHSKGLQAQDVISVSE